MFEQTFIEGTGKTKTPYTMMVSLLIQCMLIGMGILIPLIYTETLPSTQLTSFLVAPPPPPPPPPPPAAAPMKVVKVIPRQFDAGRLMAPKTIPKEILMLKEDDDAPVAGGGVGVVGGVPGGMPGGSVGGVLGSIISSAAAAAPPPPPVAKVERPAAPQRIPVGGNVQEAKLLKKPLPVYPSIARTARIQGTVVFNAIIGTDGRIQNLTLVQGPPLLVGAAQAAVTQWVYKPTLLNGEPVEVMTQISVNFTLQ
jgi:periplasmic protein TonB